MKMKWKKMKEKIKNEMKQQFNEMGKKEINKIIEWNNKWKTTKNTIKWKFEKVKRKKYKRNEMK